MTVGRLRQTAVAGEDASRYLVVFLLFGLAALLSPQFRTWMNLANLLTAASFEGMLALGLLLPILVGGIDLSVASIYALCNLVFALSQHYGVSISSYDQLSLLAPMPALMLGCAALGALLGVVNGLVVAFLRVPDFVVTLGTMAIYSGITFALTQARPVYGVVPVVQFMGTGRVLGVPVPVWVWLSMVLVAQVLLSRTFMGRYVYAVGVNSRAAYLTGIPVRAVQVTAYGFSGLTAGTAGMLMAGWINGGDPRVGEGMLLPAIASVVLGGASLRGGRGSAVGTVAGALVLALIGNILNLMGVPPFPQQVVYGLIILVALWMERFNLARGEGGSL